MKVKDLIEKLQSLNSPEASVKYQWVGADTGWVGDGGHQPTEEDVTDLLWFSPNGPNPDGFVVLWGTTVDDLNRKNQK